MCACRISHEANNRGSAKVRHPTGFPLCRFRGCSAKFRSISRGERKSGSRDSICRRSQRAKRSMRESTERWMQLCAQAATEEDPMKLIALVNEINDLLEQKERRLGMLRAGKGDSETSMA